MEHMAARHIWAQERNLRLAYIGARPCLAPPMTATKLLVPRKSTKTVADKLRGARIREALNDSGLSQAEAARRIKIGTTAMWELCDGRTTPSDETLEALCSELGVSKAWVIFGTLPKKRHSKSGVFESAVTVQRGQHNQALEHWIATSPWGQKATGEELEWLRHGSWPQDLPVGQGEDAFLYYLLSFRALPRNKSRP